MEPVDDGDARVRAVDDAVEHLGHGQVGVRAVGGPPPEEPHQHDREHGTEDGGPGEQHGLHNSHVSNRT